MSSLIRSLILIASAVCVVTAQGQRWTRPSKCSDANTKDISILKKCYRTMSLAVTLVDNAEGDFEEAYDEAEPDEDDKDPNVDYKFLRYLLKEEFDGQGVFYDDTAATLDDLSEAVTALETAGRSPTDQSLGSICPQFETDYYRQLYRQFQLVPESLYDAACRGMFTPTSSSSTSCSTVSTKSTLSSTSTSSSGSLTSPIPSSNATLSSVNSLTTPPPLAVTTSRSESSTTSCTTGVNGVSKRDVNLFNELAILARKVASALWAIGLIETNQDDSQCQLDKYWVESWNYLGLLGNYIQILM